MSNLFYTISTRAVEPKTHSRLPPRIALTSAASQRYVRTLHEDERTVQVKTEPKIEPNPKTNFCSTFRPSMIVGAAQPQEHSTDACAESGVSFHPHAKEYTFRKVSEMWGSPITAQF